MEAKCTRTNRLFQKRLIFEEKVRCDMTTIPLKQVDTYSDAHLVRFHELVLVLIYMRINIGFVASISFN